MRVSGVRDIFNPPRMASYAKGWRNVAEILWNCWSAFSLGFLSSSGSPKRFLLLWTHYGRRSHLMLHNGKTHRKQNMHGQEGMPWRCPCCLSLYKPFPQCLMLPTPAESCLLTKLMVCSVSHPPHALPTWAQAWQHLWPPPQHSELCFHQNLGHSDKPNSSCAGVRGPTMAGHLL